MALVRLFMAVVCPDPAARPTDKLTILLCQFVELLAIYVDIKLDAEPNAVLLQKFCANSGT